MADLMPSSVSLSILPPPPPPGFISSPGRSEGWGGGGVQGRGWRKSPCYAKLSSPVPTVTPGHIELGCGRRASNLGVPQDGGVGGGGGSTVTEKHLRCSVDGKNHFHCWFSRFMTKQLKLSELELNHKITELFVKTSRTEAKLW